VDFVQETTFHRMSSCHRWQLYISDKMFLIPCVIIMAEECCRIRQPCFLAECHNRRLNQGNFVFAVFCIVFRWRLHLVKARILVQLFISILKCIHCITNCMSQHKILYVSFKRFQYGLASWRYCCFLGFFLCELYLICVFSVFFICLLSCIFQNIQREWHCMA